MFRARLLIAALLVSAFTVGPVGRAGAASLFDPALRFRQLPTEHFVIYFHQGEDRIAERLARIAEDGWLALERTFGRTPPRRTRIVLADQTELFNGYATPVPYNTVVLYAVTPSGSASVSDDWLRLVFTHEFTHIVHLDRSEGWARVVRGILGRAPYAFPNLFLPPWQVEGLATYEESAITGAGRLHAGDFRALVGEAARQGRLEPLDRVNGGLTDWPAGQGVYVYGVGFHAYLAERFGARTLGALAEATARRVPYVASPAFKKVYGSSLGDLWREYEASLTSAATQPATDATFTRLTRQGFGISGPRFDRYACDGCPADIVYSAVNPNGFPALHRVSLDGGKPRRITSRYLGSTAGVGRDAIYFDQLEVRRNTGLYGDLYAFSRRDGRVRRLTSEARLLDPDLSPDETTLVAVQNRPGQRDLVLIPIKEATTAGLKARTTTDPAHADTADPGDVVQAFRPAITERVVQASRPAVVTLVAETGTQFDAPRWSPDGRAIAVERHRLGELAEIVIVDVETKTVHVLASAPDTRFVTPTWRPDGAAVVAAMAPRDDTFNLVELPLDGSTARQLTRTTGGASWPEVSPDGKIIVFVGYTTAGNDLFSTPYPSGALNPVSAIQPAGAETLAPIASPGALPTTGYSPLDTLKPTSWTPVVETGSDQIRVGAGVSGYDVLGYHAYAAAATWLVSSPAGASTPARLAPDWQAYYLYDRWRPTFFVAATSDTSFFAGAPTDTGTPTSATRRERQIEGGVIVPFRHARTQHAARISLVRGVADYTVEGGTFSRDRTPLRASWQTITARTYGYSISREGGIAIGATTELVRRDFGSTADATTSTADVRGYLPGFAQHHVIAMRLAGGASTGDATVGRTFLLGGSSPGNGVVDLASSAFALLRGFDPDTFAGSRVAVVNAEYRWPVARPQRGHGTWPLFLHTVHAAVFADAGHAWTRAFDRRAIKSSAGAQLSADVVAGFFAPLTVSVGAAYGHDGSGRIADQLNAYVRIGRAF